MYCIQSDSYGLYSNLFDTSHLTVPAPDYHEALFSPGHNIRGRLIQLINQEQEEIAVCMYTFTDIYVANALIGATQRGVRIYVILDGNQTLQVPEQENIALGLYEEGVQIGLWLPNTTALQHNKFIVFKSTTQRHIPLVWTGSYNLTVSAANMNQENVLITSATAIVTAYRERFRRLMGEARALDRVYFEAN